MLQNNSNNPITEQEYIEKINILYKKKVNIVYPYKLAVWKGSPYLRDLFFYLKKRHIKIFINCEDDLNLVLQLIEVNINTIIFSPSNIEIGKKIKSLAKKYDVEIFEYQELYNNSTTFYEFMKNR